MTTAIKPDFFDKIELFVHTVVRWIKSLSNKKSIKKIHDGLMKDPKLLIETREKFEKAFGVNSGVRTAKQWANLVRVYGIETVMKAEKLTEDQVRARCVQSFKSRVKQSLNNN